MEFVICEVSCLQTTPDQVRTRLRLRVKVVQQCPKSTANPVPDYRITNLSANRKRHVHRSTFK